ncbi:DUF4276 family protein [Rugamonas sp. A1-17]|nr:DUF4276 family protein [Rugamonas sp. A1-17]
MYLDLLVEGYVDEAVAKRLLQECGHEVGVTFGKKGWNYIEQKINAFDRSCGAQGLFTLVDCMDTGKACAVEVVNDWLPQPGIAHVFRVVVREIESWILADRTGIASFLSVPLSKVPLAPDSLADPKQALIGLARTSRSKRVREDLVPRPGYAAVEGALYATEIVRFVNEQWNPVEAKLQSDSLNRCINRLTQLPR